MAPRTALALLLCCCSFRAAAAAAPPAGGGDSGSTPLFVTFDSGVDTDALKNGSLPGVAQVRFVWGAAADPDRLAAWRSGAAPGVVLSHYMPYSRSPAASLGFDLGFWQAHHPDWILYRCDRETVAFWNGETAPHGSVPLDFSNPAVVAWQVANQTGFARAHGYDAMAFDNYGGGARAGANPGRACGVFDRNGTWQYRFGQTNATAAGFNNTASMPVMREASVAWLERVHAAMQSTAPGLGIVPNLCVDNAGWVDSDDARRVAASVTGVLSERGFTGWGSGRISEHELLDEFVWMETLARLNKTYYSINEIQAAEWSDDWVEWVMACFLVGQQAGSALWIGKVQGYGVLSYQPQLGADLGEPTGERYRTGEWPILLRRNYTRGAVILNPSEAVTAVTLGEGFTDLTGAPVPPGRVVFRGQTAKVFLRDTVF